MRELPTHFPYQETESHLYDKWLKSQAFTADANSVKPAYSMVLPPPNVTGILHIGHALDHTLQDILARFKRQMGYEVLWLPGLDHAGIATQMVVEKELAKKNQHRQDLGREAFLQEVWKWKESSGGKILEQIRSLGSSCDWSRERFTMDEGLSKAVRAVFVALFKQGKIYQSDYLISWSPGLRTAISDLEVEHKEVQGTLTWIVYQSVHRDFELVVATTRPETLLGDTGLAVHPDDDRYKHLIGKKVKHPFFDRDIPIVADDGVDAQFGTGVVKLTPAHDPLDYEIGKRHQLQIISIFDEEARISLPGSEFHGLNRKESRKAVVEALTKKGLVRDQKPHVHMVGHCQRSGAPIEYRISKQWFLDVKEMASRAKKAVDDRRTQFIPEFWSKTYDQWMVNIRDWCISRQLWWGHQIPVWYCAPEKHVNCSELPPTTCQTCGSKQLIQDPDVLDTWFSSALWPFSTMGWPEQTDTLKKFYPTTVLVTGFDIIFFWVARMMMMGLHFMNEVPFKKVHIHALVRDEHGQKMSKTKGNTMDPLELIQKYGADAFRFALAAFAIQGRDIPLSEKRIEGYRNFTTKIWNASKFCFSQGAVAPHAKSSDLVATTVAQAWILDELHLMQNKVILAYEEMRFNEAADHLYRFVWTQFCDWYLEIAKIELKDPQHADTCKKVLGYALDRIYAVLHPISPFITEFLWQHLHEDETQVLDYISIQRQLEIKYVHNSIEHAKVEMENVMHAVEGIRIFRAQHKLHPNKTIAHAYKKSKNGLISGLGLAYLKGLSGIAELAAYHDQIVRPSLAYKNGEEEYWISLNDISDPKEEQARLEKQIQEAQKDIKFLSDRLASESYKAKAPTHLIEKDQAKLAKFKETLATYQSELAKLMQHG